MIWLKPCDRLTPSCCASREPNKARRCGLAPLKRKGPEREVPALVQLRQNLTDLDGFPRTLKVPA